MHFLSLSSSWLSISLLGVDRNICMHGWGAVWDWRSGGKNKPKQPDNLFCGAGAVLLFDLAVASYLTVQMVILTQKILGGLRIRIKRNSFKLSLSLGECWMNHEIIGVLYVKYFCFVNSDVKKWVGLGNKYGLADVISPCLEAFTPHGNKGEVCTFLSLECRYVV